MTILLLLIIVGLLGAMFFRHTFRSPRLNLRRGVVRLWLALSAAWIVFLWAVGDRRLTEFAIPPVVLGAILGTAVWIVEGFKLRPATNPIVRRVHVIAKGLMFRFRLPDETIVMVPAVQLFNDAIRDKALSSVFGMWGAGVNGPLDSLATHPSIRDYLYNWAVDRSHCLGLGARPSAVDADENAVWVTPDMETAWFWLPEGVSRSDVISVPLKEYSQDVQADRELFADFASWMKSSGTRDGLSRYPRVLAYLKHKTEVKLTPIIEDLQRAKAAGTLPMELEPLLKTPESVPDANEEKLEDKKRELSELEAELVNKELEFASLSAELHTFESEYLASVGRRYVDLDRLEAEIAELHSSLEPGNESLRHESEQAHAQAQRSSDDYRDSSKDRIVCDAQSDELKKLYRDVAKKVHPDLADDEDDRELRADLMLQVNAAYQRGDKDTLIGILMTWNGETHRGVATPYDLMRVERRLARTKERIKFVQGEIATLQKSDLAQLHNEAKRLRLKGKDLLSELCRKLDAKIATKQASLRAVMEKQTQ